MRIECVCSQSAVDLLLDMNVDGIVLKDASFLFEANPDNKCTEGLNSIIPAKGNLLNRFERFNHTCSLNQRESYSLVAHMAARIEQHNSTARRRFPRCLPIACRSSAVRVSHVLQVSTWSTCSMRVPRAGG